MKLIFPQPGYVKGIPTEGSDHTPGIPGNPELPMGPFRQDKIPIWIHCCPKQYTENPRYFLFRLADHEKVNMLNRWMAALCSIGETIEVAL